MFAKLLVANRGEIALRVFRACRELGISTVAVVAPNDTGSLHARSADETVEIAQLPLLGGAHPRGARRRARTRSTPGTDSWRRAPTSRRRSKRPGSSSSGPSPEALRGRRRQARGEADRARGRRSRRPEQGEPEEVGFPLLVKAAAGGGGRGMRVVRSPGELEEALEAARREAKAAFGDDRVFCERYVERPRHVEIQLLADAHGTRRRARRARVLDPATPPEGAGGVALARARRRAARADERGGGHLRARDRLPQRGHRGVHARRPRLLLPRAERPHPGRAPRHRAVTGVDLVQEQIRIARRRAARCGRADGSRATRSRCGSTRRIRARFLPQTRPDRAAAASGRRSASTRASRRATRSAIAYDPLIAKLIAHGQTRDEALDRLGRRWTRPRSTA